MTYTMAQAAQVLHELNRAIQSANGEQALSPHWEELDEAVRSQRISELAAEVTAGRTPRQSYDSWYHARASEGWTYGPVKDEERKTSPYLVPYTELPWEQLIKDDARVAVREVLLGQGRPVRSPGLHGRRHRAVRQFLLLSSITTFTAGIIVPCMLSSAWWLALLIPALVLAVLHDRASADRWRESS